MNELLNDKLENLPSLPGIYQFLNEKGKVIYIGKAKNLKNRVRSYFHKCIDTPKTEILVSKIEDLQIIVTNSEIEALVLENNLIKELKPRYNVLLKDDKSFPYIRVTNELFPQIFPTRNIIKDGSRYFGPYTDVKNMRSSLRLITKIFRIRSCKFDITQDAIEKKKIKICLDYHIKKCEGPCEGLVNAERYNSMVNQAVKVFRGKGDELLDELKKLMLEASSRLEFEKAAELRDRLEQLQVYTSKQRVVSADMEDRDIISAAFEGKDVSATILNIRSGKLVGKRQLTLSAEVNESAANIYSAVLKFYYDEFVEVPKEIIIEFEPEDSDALLEWLNSRAVRKTSFTIPQRQSEAKSLLVMCKQNAILALKEIQLQKMKKEGNIPYVLSALQRDLRLKKLPRLIECFDNSNIQGSDAVASMVVFEDGKPKKSLYRKFIIKTVEGPDDFASMREIIRRRYSRVVEDKLRFPDLIMVDGGKGQLSSAVEILDELKIKNYEIIGLAKRLEEIFIPGNSEAQSIPKTSSSLKLLQHIRDEAHRFAITFHRERRSKRTFLTELTEIKGIGEKVAQKLLTGLGSLEAVKKASEEELLKIVGKAKAKLIFDFYDV
ncbi:MAG: excinuclease ABC subunit C [Ignavibacteria bacterium]|nr:MAG: excinuclease ABC subunit C [Ignavibacteria bacterium]KAF0161337.1 MAG: excinuclease ABC subunit C [Ignavibacteria bacterium]